MKIFNYLFVFFLCVSIISNAQSIKGKFPSLKNQTIKLIGFTGLNTYIIDSSIITSNGDFNLRYTSNDYGIGYLKTNLGSLNYRLILEKNNIELEVKSTSQKPAININKGIENILISKYYDTNQNNNHLSNLDFNLLNNLPNNSFLKWYISSLDKINNISIILKKNSNYLFSNIDSLNLFNYDNVNIIKSDLLNDILELHFYLIENCSKSKDSILSNFKNTSIIILNSVSNNELIFNQISKFLFEYFEKRNMSEVSNYLSSYILTQNKVKIEERLRKQLLSSKEMNIGKYAPDIVFSGDVYQNNKILSTSILKISNLKNQYKVVFFGASWCPSCSVEMIKLLPLYKYWISKNVEVVFVSLDTDKIVFRNYVSIMPFISFCDYKKWDTQAAKDYNVLSSPTLFLLDKKNKIILRTSSINDIAKMINKLDY